eukprot:TRINITY_DN5379_c0_g1_i1.p1 TRINITY_DN5379_c0_g1~~TRINITY_DN5379_c0_g1_i1.p1  ORF type:complete len:296 (-),score=73.48 TRINITY_DN5379_c0_g1_i1:674-1561(-)
MALPFTPQQLAGHRGFRSRTMIGNWSEEIQLQEERLREWLRKRAQGALFSQQIGDKFRRHLAEAFVSPQHADGNLRFGDTVLLQNAHTRGYLSVDTDDRLPGLIPKYGLTSAAADKALLRNAWTLIKVAGTDDELYQARGEADVVHYGQKLKLVLNPMLMPREDKLLFLYTSPVSPTAFSKVSNKQEVCAVEFGPGSFDLVWQCVFADRDYRVEMEGEPVKANTVLLLSHVQTNQPLSADAAKFYPNDFGRECEVCCHKWPAMQTKLSNLPELPQNHWAFITGPPLTEAELREEQ